MAASASESDIAIGGLERRLRTPDALALVISNVVGVGIFTTPGIVAEVVPHPAWILGLWGIGGLISLAGALAYAELAVLRPKAGGEYVYLREAFGPLWAFLTGWTSFVAGFSGAIAAGAIGLAAYLGYLVPWAAERHPFFALSLGGMRLALSPQSMVALLVILLLSWIHRRGLEPGRWFQNILTGLKVLALLGLVAMGFASARGSAEYLRAAAPPVSFTQGLGALIPILFAYSGWNAAVYMAEEVREPQRTLPRALIGGTLAVTGLYLLLVALYLWVRPVPEWAGTIHTGSLIAQELLGAWGAHVFTVLVLLALLGCVSAMIVTGPRIYYAMARDGLFWPHAARLHPKYRTPSVAIWSQAIWSGLLVLSGTFEQLLTYTGFAVVLFSAIAVVALFVLRRARPDEARSFRAWGYPVVPALFVGASLAIVVNTFRESPGPSGLGLLLIASGIPLYAFFVKRTSRSGRKESRGALSPEPSQEGEDERA